MLRKLKYRLDRTVRRRLFAKDADAFVPAFNRLNPHFFHYAIRLDYEPDGGLINVIADGQNIFVGRPRRTAFYRQGIARRLAQVATDYFLDRIPIRHGDLVIDVGANVGELSKIVAASGARTISVEPEPVEIAALRRNLAEADNVIVPQALWNEETELTLFSKNDTGDSSLIEMNGFESRRTIPVTTLDNVYRAHGGGQPVRLLKLEAEGAEPEILQGADEMLARVEFISADLGPERGVRCENTVAPVSAHLMDRGFRPIAFGHERGVMLFERRIR